MSTARKESCRVDATSVQNTKTPISTRNLRTCLPHITYPMGFHLTQCGLGSVPDMTYNVFSGTLNPTQQRTEADHQTKWHPNHYPSNRLAIIHQRHRERDRTDRTVFSERELVLTFAICCRPSVCRLSSVCNARAPYSGG